jgi:ubiquinone/menaquinone biosynthesis C-methylase UbiE
MMDHKKLYNHKKITKDYAKRDYLDRAELQIFEDLRPVLPKINMLDMGVGGGRTTSYFMPTVNSYIGADYAPNMIAECKKKFKNNKNFEVLDVRNMNKFSDNMFDLVLFSFNGIDSFGLNDREIALNEIKRVLKNNAYFCFSSHNVNWEVIYDLFKFNYIYEKLLDKIKNKGNFLMKFIIFLKAIFINIMLDIKNKSLNIRFHINNLQKAGYGYLMDNSLNGKAKIFYSSYKFQIEQLNKFGFKNISAYSINGIKTEDENELNKGGWIYYLCQVEK